MPELGRREVADRRCAAAPLRLQAGGGRGGGSALKRPAAPPAVASGAGAQQAGSSAAASTERLNWGCGEHTAAGWINSDRDEGPHVDLSCDIREGLPLESNSIDYAVSVHALPELAYPELVPALIELRRVLRPGGALRLVLPDMRKAIRAYLLRRSDYFKVPETEIRSDGGRFIVHMLWYGHSRTLFTADFAEELLRKAGFTDVRECRYKETASRFADLVELDNREHESFYVEGTKAEVAAEVEPDPDSEPSPEPAPEPDSGPAPDPASEPSPEPAPAPDREPSPEPADQAQPEDREAPAGGGPIEVMSVKLAGRDDERLLGFHLGRPKPGRLDSPWITIAGWVVGRQSPAVAIEVEYDGDVVARAAVDVKRPPVAKRFPDVPQALLSGFTLRLEAAGAGESALDVRAVLEDDTRVPLAGVVTRVSVADEPPA